MRVVTFSIAERMTNSLGLSKLLMKSRGRFSFLLTLGGFVSLISFVSLILILRGVFVVVGGVVGGVFVVVGGVVGGFVGGVVGGVVGGFVGGFVRGVVGGITLFTPLVFRVFLTVFALLQMFDLVIDCICDFPGEIIKIFIVIDSSIN